MAKKRRLKRTSRGSIVLPNGERITPSEQRALRSAVNSANRKRKKWLEELGEEHKQRYKDFGIESDFVHRKKSASFSRFRNKKEFLKYLRGVQKISSGYFEKQRYKTYKANYIVGLQRVFGECKELIKLVNLFTPEEFGKATEAGVIPELNFVYHDPKAKSDKYFEVEAGLNRAIGMFVGNG